LRPTMVRPGRDKLSGSVEIDETLIGGQDKGGRRGRKAGRQSLVAIAVEVHEPKGFGRIRMQRIPDASGRSLIPFARSFVVSASTVPTYFRRGYNGLKRFGNIHKRVKLSESGDPAHGLLFYSLLQQAMLAPSVTYKEMIAHGQQHG